MIMRTKEKRPDGCQASSSYRKLYPEAVSCEEKFARYSAGGAEYRVSENEIGHFEEMVRDFYDVLCENDLLDDFGELVEDNLNRVLDSMTKGCNDD